MKRSKDKLYWLAVDTFGHECLDRYYKTYDWVGDMIEDATQAFFRL